MKRLCLSLTLAIVATLLIVMPVLASYFAYIYVHETAGNTYDNLPVICEANITQLVATHFITSSGLDTRVLTGSGEALPHMLANDKILFATDLEAYEDKSLVFYMGATSLSSFPIIVGYNGSFETPDDPSLELGYVMELLVSGYFNAGAGDAGHNILYKVDAFRVWISAANTIKVATYNSTGDEQWEMSWNNFTTGEHTVYIVCNGMFAKLYVDNFAVEKDSQQLWETNNQLLYSGADALAGGQFSREGRTFYTNDLYWGFYVKSTNLTGFWYRTSADGAAWATEAFEAFPLTYLDNGICFWHQVGTNYFHVVYKAHAVAVADRDLYYRKGTAESNGTITWSDAWQLIDISTLGLTNAVADYPKIGTDLQGYPCITFKTTWTRDRQAVIKSSTNDGTWVLAGGYPVQWSGTNPYEAAQDTLIVGYPNSNKMYAIRTQGQHDWPYSYEVDIIGRYYNNSTWGGSDEWILDAGVDAYISAFDAVADKNDNVYFFYGRGSPINTLYLRVRYADGTFSSPYTVASANSFGAISYSPDNNAIYLFYQSSGNIVFQYLYLVDYTLHGPYTLCTSTNSYMTASPYATETNTGVLFQDSGSVNHVNIDLPWPWNDNSNDWYWMQDNVMPYADQIIMAVDGTSVLEYQPAAIIQGTTLPDETDSGNDGIITWGTNPAGVTVSISSLQSEQSYNETYYYQYLNPGSTDIIKPEPEGMGADVDLVKLHGNPLYPLVQVLTIAGFLTERLVWLGLAWFIVIVAMFLVHLGPDTHKDSEKPQHFVLTTITGLGLSIMFYAMGIFPLWVIILMAFGLVGAVIWERQPVI
jgi:hypothetical protein